MYFSYCFILIKGFESHKFENMLQIWRLRLGLKNTLKQILKGVFHRTLQYFFHYLNAPSGGPSTNYFLFICFKW